MLQSLTLQYLLGRFAILIIASAIAYGAGYWRASSHCSVRIQAIALKSELESAQINLTQTHKAHEDAEQKLAIMRAENADVKEAIHDFAGDVAARQNRDPCRLSDDDAQRLRAIR